MSTIASPRDPSPLLRRTNSSQAVGTPTSSARPSLEIPRSRTSSPGLALGPQDPPSKRTNRAALREYYNLGKIPRSASSNRILLEVTGTDSVSDPVETSYSEVPLSEIDADDFKPDMYVKNKLKNNSLEELLQTYTRILGEIRALDAEKKALVYDNYSKLITATETIRKMRAKMDPLNPMASTLDPAIAQIYSQASSIREGLRQSTPKPGTDLNIEEEFARQRRPKDLISEVLGTPDRIRVLVKEGKLEAAEEAWRIPKRLLTKWKEDGVGGEDVVACLEAGESAILE